MIKRAEDSRRPLPDSIINSPELLPGLSLYYHGFTVLNSCRSIGQGGEGPIPWTAIRSYCNDYDIQDEQRDYFMDMIYAMDTAYLEHSAKRAEANATKSTKPINKRQ